MRENHDQVKGKRKQTEGDLKKAWGQTYQRQRKDSGRRTRQR
jgi:uncharacterized protein YjbJ (UPF0337 family)